MIEESFYLLALVVIVIYMIHTHVPTCPQIFFVHLVAFVWKLLSIFSFIVPSSGKFGLDCMLGIRRCWESLASFRSQCLFSFQTLKDTRQSYLLIWSISCMLLIINNIWMYRNTCLHQGGEISSHNLIQ